MELDLNKINKLSGLLQDSFDFIFSLYQQNLKLHKFAVRHRGDDPLPIDVDIMEDRDILMTLAKIKEEADNLLCERDYILNTE